jgi:hypothetical protein
MSACRSHEPTSRVCKDGFIQRSLCSGNAGCPTCGNIGAEYLPFCLQDELPAHMATDDGQPLFYLPPLPPDKGYGS